DIKGFGVNFNAGMGKETSVSGGLKLAKRDYKLKLGANEDGLGIKGTKEHNDVLSGRELGFDKRGISWNAIHGYTRKGEDIKETTEMSKLLEGVEFDLEDVTYTNKTIRRMGRIGWKYAPAIVIIVFLVFNPELIPMVLPKVSEYVPVFLLMGN